MTTAATSRNEAATPELSPDDLDQALRIVKPVGWVAAITCGMVLLLGLLWSIFGTYRITVQGKGLIHAEDGIFVEVFAPKEGWLEYLAPIGQDVQRGQLIAKLEAPESSKTLSGLTAKADQLTRQQNAIKTRYRERIDAERSASAQRRGVLDDMSAQLAIKLDAAEKRLATREASLAKGDATLDQVDETRERVYAGRQEIGQLQTQLRDLDKPILELQTQRDHELEMLDRDLQQSGSEIDSAKLTLNLATQVYSQDPGHVVMAPVSLHSLVPAGKSIMTLETGAAGLEVLAFVSADQGKNVYPGMSVRISPTNVRREEFGSLVGRVTWVSPLPQSHEEVVSKLAHSDLAAIFTKDGPPIAVRVALVPDPITPSGYRWTSERGSTQILSSGTLVDVWIAVKQAPPITLVLPELNIE